MKRSLDPNNNADTLWNSFSHTGKIGAYLMYRAIAQREKKEGGAQ